MGFPVILEHEDACGVVGTKEVKTPAIAATALILASRGADQILVPCPSEYDLERTGLGVELLPATRRSCVSVIDRKGEVLRRVREYLRPLASCASEWPETAFVDFSEGFLYQLALGAKHRAGILSSSVQKLIEFVPIIRPEQFKGEARFRLAELIALICSYEPHQLDHGAFRLETQVEDGFSPAVWDLLDNAEFRAVVSVSGRLGYLKHPLVGLRRLQNVVQKFFSQEDAKSFFSLAKTTAECAGAGSAASAAERVFDALVQMKGTAFRPPFIGMGAARFGIYKVALADSYPDATPPPGTIMVFESSRAGRTGLRWLNVGEEEKLAREDANPQTRDDGFAKAKAAQNRFLL